MIKVIHKSKCPKSRAILEYLDENDIKFQIIDVIKEPLSLFELRTLFKKLNKKPSILKAITTIMSNLNKRKNLLFR